MSSRAILQFAGALTAAGLAVNSAACAPMPFRNSAHLPKAQMQRIGQICRQVMGLSGDNTSQYDACSDSLSHTFAAEAKDGAMAAARQACNARGLKPRTVALSECELKMSPQMVPASTGAAAAPAPSADPVGSYFSASNAEIRRREQQACVQIGEDPATPAFAQCVTSLDGDLFDADNPTP